MYVRLPWAGFDILPGSSKYIQNFRNRGYITSDSWILDSLELRLIFKDLSPFQIERTLPVYLMRRRRGSIIEQQER